MTRLVHPLIDKWRIIEMDLWDRGYLDLCGPVSLMVKVNGEGEIDFGAMQGRLDIDYKPSEIGLASSGFDEIDEVTGSGSAALKDGGSLQIEFGYQNGDEAVLKAAREPSSTAC